ncbi:aspartic peptidase domain-containing protein [Mycena polygramma]|nr:aspartic peptidase domain-containing protein [Mycena polygramma]
MWSLTLALLLAVSVRLSCGLVVQSTRVSSILVRDQPTGATLDAISNARLTGTADRLDVRYATNITANGRNFRVAIDTGSSDLWIAPPGDFAFNNTGIPISDGFLGGDVNGTIGFASVQFGGHTVNGQAFNNATTVKVGGLIDLGLDGLLGLSFNAVTVSPIMKTFQSKGMDPNLGETFLFNIFDQTPGQNNFIGISLSRTDDLEGSAGASFGINEVDQTYAAVSQASPVPLFPSTNRVWSVLLDGISVEGAEDVILPASNVDGTPPGKLVAVLDTGTPTALFPKQLLDAIYSRIPGASLINDHGQTVWSIPCNTTTSASVLIGGQRFPIHPLDLSDVITDDRSTPICVSMWTAGAKGDPRFDIIFGDSFMRNFYTLFNFGDTTSQAPTGNPSVQLLSQTNATAAAEDVLNVRMALLSKAGHVSSAVICSSKPRLIVVLLLAGLVHFTGQSF